MLDYPVALKAIWKRSAEMAEFSTSACSFSLFLPFTRRVSPRRALKRKPKLTAQLFQAGVTRVKETLTVLSFFAACTGSSQTAKTSFFTNPGLN